MAIFGQNHWLTRLKKCEFFNFLNFFFYSLERRFFILEYRKRHFPGLYCLKKKLKKWLFLDKTMALKKCQTFDFSTSCCYSLETLFFVLENRKRHFPGQNPDFEKMSNFRLLNFLLL